MAKNADGQFGFSPISVNFLVEVVKTIFALGTLIMYGTGSPGAPLYLSVSAFARDASHNKLLAVPAGLYAVNNYLKFAMQLYFKPTTAKMLSNLKVGLVLYAFFGNFSRCIYIVNKQLYIILTSLCMILLRST